MIECEKVIYQGDALSVLGGLDPECIDMCMTSPPYWGLRDYGHENQLGLEPTPELYIEHMTEIFHEVKRVLKKEGTLWLNIGDTYWSAKGTCFNPGGNESALEANKKEMGAYPLNRGNKSDVPNLPPKCLAMIPERLAWSLIQDGWILRNKIVWSKPNAMPSSVKDRFSNKWEYVFMFSKSKKYYFDLDAVREPHKEESLQRESYGFHDTKKHQQLRETGIANHDLLSMHKIGKNPGDVFEIPSETRSMGAIIGDSGAVKVPGGKGWTGHPEGGGAACQKDPRWCPPDGKNPGDFWEIPTQPFPEAHFAVFPEKLCEKPIKAGCPEQVCKKCGKARERMVNHKSNYIKREQAHAPRSEPSKVDSTGWKPPDIQQIGWTDCGCNVGFEGGTVLDPFCGAGTVGVVAKELGRNFIGIDIKKEYCEMAEKRIVKVGYQQELAL